MIFFDENSLKIDDFRRERKKKVLTMIRDDKKHIFGKLVEIF